VSECEVWRSGEAAASLGDRAFSVQVAGKGSSREFPDRAFSELPTTHPQRALRHKSLVPPCFVNQLLDLLGQGEWPVALQDTPDRNWKE